MNTQIDFYTGIHKGQRSTFFAISREAGIIDCADQSSMDRLQEKLESFKEHMRLHAALEEKFIHPLLSERVPGGSRRLDEEHRIMHQHFDDILAHLKGVRAKSPDFEKQQDLALEFYRAWNRFMAFYFTHIDYEEEDVQSSLWKLCTGKELGEAFRLILADQSPEELAGNLEMMLPAMSLSERVSLLNAGRVNMPPQAFQAALKLAERVLNSSDWVALKSELMMS